MKKNKHHQYVQLASNALLHVVQLDDDTVACRIETSVQKTDWEIKHFDKKAQQAERCNP